VRLKVERRGKTAPKGPVRVRHASWTETVVCGCKGVRLTSLEGLGSESGSITAGDDTIRAVK